MPTQVDAASFIAMKPRQYRELRDRGVVPCVSHAKLEEVLYAYLAHLRRQINPDVPGGTGREHWRTVIGALRDRRVAAAWKALDAEIERHLPALDGEAVRLARADVFRLLERAALMAPQRGQLEI